MKNSIVVDGVTYYREQPDLIKAKAVLEKYEWLTGDIRHFVQEAQALYDNMKDEGLSIGMIEAEGYLRAMKTLAEKVKYIEECSTEPEID